MVLENKKGEIAFNTMENWDGESLKNLAETLASFAGKDYNTSTLITEKDIALWLKDNWDTVTGRNNYKC